MRLEEGGFRTFDEYEAARADVRARYLACAPAVPARAAVLHEFMEEALAAAASRIVHAMFRAQASRPLPGLNRPGPARTRADPCAREAALRP